MYAISAAGVAYSVTRACSRGELTECGCDERIRQRPTRGRYGGGLVQVINRYTDRYIDKQIRTNTNAGRWMNMNYYVCMYFSHHLRVKRSYRTIQFATSNLSSPTTSFCKLHYIICTFSSPYYYSYLLVSSICSNLNFEQHAFLN